MSVVRLQKLRQRSAPRPYPRPQVVREELLTFPCYLIAPGAMLELSVRPMCVSRAHALRASGDTRYSFELVSLRIGMNTQSATLTGQALELVLTEKMSQAAEDWESTWRGLVDLEVAQPGCDYTITLRNHSQLAREARLALEAKVVYG